VNTFINATIGITGASGNLGRHVLRQLSAAGARRIIGLTRDPDRFPEKLPDGVELRRATFDDPATLPAAFAGIERLLIVSVDKLAGRGELQRAAVDAAVKAGVGHLLYTGVTSPYPDADPAALVPDSHYWTETRIAESGVGFSFLRNNLYTDFLIPGAQAAIASGTLYHAAGAGGRAYVTREDCAAAAAAALLNAEGRQVYDIGGPEAVSSDDLAALLTRISGKPVKAVNVPAEGFAAGLVKAGVPQEMAAVLARFDVDAAKGRLAVVSGDFETLTGRKPRSVADFLAAHKQALAG
jgi:NAD(P)H dehydrogenase (quinone)